MIGVVSLVEIVVPAFVGGNQRNRHSKSNTTRLLSAPSSALDTQKDLGGRMAIRKLHQVCLLTLVFSLVTVAANAQSFRVQCPRTPSLTQRLSTTTTRNLPTRGQQL